VTVYFASNNPHKAGELQSLAGIGRLPFVFRTAMDIGGMPDVAEDTGTFEGNARVKARALRRLAPGDAGVLSDDSGLCVDALGGQPGVDSAYFAGKPGDPRANLELLVRRLQGVPPARRTAHFVCVLVFIDPAGREFLFEGRCDGTLLERPAGSHGFGYDPLFVPAGHKESFSVLGPETKNSISARSRAWSAFTSWFTASCTDQHF
jgi:XTP/dITP diphosphohydrolase